MENKSIYEYNLSYDANARKLKCDVEYIENKYEDIDSFIDHPMAMTQDSYRMYSHSGEQFKHFLEAVSKEEKRRSLAHKRLSEIHTEVAARVDEILPSYEVKA